MQTQDYNIRAVYDYIDGKQVFKGYEVSYYLKIIVKNIDIVGEAKLKISNEAVPIEAGVNKIRAEVEVTFIYN